MNSRRRPTHPGEVFREDVIKPLGLTVTEAATAVGNSLVPVVEDGRIFGMPFSVAVSALETRGDRRRERGTTVSRKPGTEVLI